MKKLFTPLFIAGLFCCSSLSLMAQDKTERPDKLYSMSGIGFSFPIGKTGDYLKPKFSTSMGLNIGLGKSGLFLYPKVSLHAYGANELSPDPGYSYSLQ